MKKLVVIILFLALLSCKGNETKRYIEQWEGETIELPNDTPFLRYGLDTVVADSLWSIAKTKIFVYVDAEGCTSCKLRLKDLLLFEKYIRKDLKCEVPVLLYFDNKSVSDVSVLLKTSGYDHPVCVDTTGRLAKRYTFSHNLTLNSFLLDSLNRVILVGYPMHNKEVEQMYINEILKRNL